MYTRKTYRSEKSNEHLSINVISRSPSPAVNSRPISPLARSFSPRTLEHEHLEALPSPLPSSPLQNQHNQQFFVDQKVQRRRKWIITTAVLTGIVIVGLVVGLSLGLTFGRRVKDDRTPAYVPAVAEHATPENNLMVQMFEWNIPKNSTHWITLAEDLQNLKVLGTKNIWIPPATKNSNKYAIGYDVYDLWDLGEFNAKGNTSTNMGTKGQLQKLTRKATDLGIGVIYDAVFNQRTGADGKVTCPAHSVDDKNRLHVTSESFQMNAWLQFTFPARKGKYSSKTWGCDDFTAIDVNADTGETGVWKIEGTDNDFATDVNTENGNYDYLLLADVAYHNPSVRADALAWVKWINTELELTGFRLDAAKHLSESFVLEVLNTVKAGNNGQDKFFAAEYFTSNLSAMTEYFEVLESRPMMFDTLLLTNFAQFAAGNVTDLSKILNYTFIAEHPEKAVTFVATHDTQQGQSLDVLNVSNWFTPLAYAIILLRKDGLPCLFYGDIYGTYNNYTTIFTPGPYRQMIANMAIARKYWAYGDQTDYFTTNPNNSSTPVSIIGWTRQGIVGDRPDGLAVVISIANTSSSLEMDVGIHHAGEVWTDLTQNIITKQVTINVDGTAVFPVRGQSVSVWTNNNAAEGRDSLGKFNGDIYRLAPFEIGHATSQYQSGAPAQQVLS